MYRFGEFELDVSQHALRCDGERVDMQPKVFDLLLFLIENRDRAVDKDELQSAVWKTIVSETSLTRAVMKARRAVGDDANRQAVIRTVHRHGYQFVAPIAASEAATGTDHVTPVRDSAAPVDVPSLAVLPFADLSPDGDHEYFCEGMAEEILNALSRLGGIQLAARTSALQFRKQAVDVRDVGEALGVQKVLEGSVRRAGDRLRVTAQLIDARSGYHLWSERYDREREDVFEIQDDIAARIAEALRLKLTPGDHANIRNRAASSFAVYDRYLHGLKFLRGFGRRNLNLAIDMFSGALDIDPYYAPAWAGLSLAYCLMYHYADASDVNREKALETSRRAIELDEDSAEAQTAYGLAAALENNFDLAERAFERAIDLNPVLYEAWYYYARCCCARGNFEKAVDLFERAAEIDPEDYQAVNLSMQAYESIGNREGKLDAARRAVERAEKWLQTNPEDIRALYLTADAWSILGHPELGIAWAERALAIEPNDAATNYNAACAYVSAGNHERALDLLESATATGLANRHWMENDAMLDPLREMPRFQAIMDSVK